MGKHSKAGGRGRTDFENHDLDEMIDLVESARPTDMMAVADALGGVARQIADAANELGRHIDDVEWEGEAAKAFRTWGKDLAKNTLKLGDYADAVGQEMGNVGFGLSSVQHSMPTRADGRGGAVGEIPAPARIVTNKDYVKAKAADDAKHEAARQDAIVEMNKLSSYYRTSEERLEVASQDAPVFKPPENMGMVPKPPERSGTPIQPTSPPSGGAAALSQGHATPEHSGPVSPHHEVGTELDSVTMPKAPDGDTSARPTAPSGGGQSVPSHTVGPLTPGPPPGPGATRSPGGLRQSPPPFRGTGAGSLPQKGQSERSNSSLPRGLGTQGRLPGDVGAGRSSTIGPSRAGRSEGVVGGVPRRPGDNGGTARLPRGTVIGGEHTASGQGAGSSASRRLTSNPGGIVGTPRSATRGAKDFTPGGTGLVRGSGPASGSGGPRATAGLASAKREPERDSSARPEYLSEDQETWKTRRRDIVPPVID
ncbi:hypothetical protein [Streptomyces sp. NPDC053560]|uniref:hypothetical protein n=1 Tax=Streptomyces sp. NPDC053560 TaxID=3365711 RepID=UPI0037D3976C